MAAAAPAAAAVDSAARRLLGWSPPSAADDGRSAAAGDATFRRAESLLASDEGRIAFRRRRSAAAAAVGGVAGGVGGGRGEGGGSGGCGGGDEGGGPTFRDPTSIVEGYFRLLRSSLDSNRAGALVQDVGTALLTALRDDSALARSHVSPASSPSSRPSSGEARRVRRDSERDRAAVLLYLRSTALVVHPIARNRPRILQPSYRTYCEVADAFLSLLEFEKSEAEKFVEAFLPSLGWEALSGMRDDVASVRTRWAECDASLARAGANASRLSEDALGEMRKAMSGGGDGGGDGRTSPSPQNVVKILVFAFARMSSLSEMRMRFRRAFPDDGATGSEEGAVPSPPSSGEVLPDFLRRLVETCALALDARAALEREANRAEEPEGQGRGKLLAAVAGLRTKAEQYMAKVLADPTDEVAANAVLEGFVACAPTNAAEVAPSVALARLILTKLALNRILAAGPAARLEPRSTLRFVEAMLFEDVPACYQSFNTTSGCALRTQALEVVSEVACVLERASHVLCLASEPRGRGRGEGRGHWRADLVRQHHLLLRWLAPTLASLDRDPSKAASLLHPMTNELLLLMLYKRIVLSCAADDRRSRYDAAHLLSMLSQLMLHPQTGTAHRGSVATVLVRLLSSSSKCSAEGQDEARLLTIRTLWSGVKRSNILDGRAGRKRKRSEGEPPSMVLSPDNASAVCLVLEALAKASSLAYRVDIPDEVSTQIKKLWGSILNRSADGRDAVRTTFLLALLAGAIRGTSNLLDFPSSLEDKTAVIESTIAFVKQRLETKNKERKRSARTLAMLSACIGLVHALSDRAGSDLSEAHVIQMAKVLKEAGVIASSVTSVHTIRLHYDVFSTASRLGSVIRPEFGEESLQLLAQLMNVSLAKSSWYLLAPSISDFSCFIRALPSHLKPVIYRAIPSFALADQRNPSLSRTLATSRLQGKLFGVVEGKMIDPLDDAAYSTGREHRFLLINKDTSARESLSLLEGDNVMLIKAGSQVFVRRGEDGKIVSMVIAPMHTERSGCTTEILSAVGPSKFDALHIQSNCEMMLG
ncbi:hypothetical protein ACHAWF_018787 [Thalassiosira exigua]